VRRFEAKRIEVRRGARAHCRCRFRVETPADALDSGEEFRRPGGVSCRRTKGRWRRWPGPFIGVARGRNGRAITRIEGGRGNGGSGVISAGGGRRRRC
jgi:hypothetical protein